MKIQAGDYMVLCNDEPTVSIGIFRPRPGTQYLLELHFIDGASRFNVPINKSFDFFQLALVTGKMTDMDIALVDRSATTDPILKKYPAYRFSNAPAFDPTR